MLEINEDTAFQRKQLRIARVAVALFGVLIVLALLGLFGSGPLSYATAGGARDGFSIDYQRFLRFGEDTDLEVRPAPRRRRRCRSTATTSTASSSAACFRSPTRRAHRADGCS